MDFSAEPQKDWHPRPEQKLAIKWLLEHQGAGLFADPGSGKTSITLGAFKILKKQKLAERMLVIAPMRPCYLVWPEQIYHWKDFNGIRYQILHGSKKNAAIEEDADVYIINPDGLPWLMAEKRFDNLGIDTLAVDESSKFKRANTQRFKLLKPVLSSFRRRWILTGSPIPNGYLDLFGQIYIIDMGRALGQFITHYRFNYFIPTGYGGYTWVLKPGGDKMVDKAIAPYIFRIEADNSTLPQVVDNVIRVELPDEARRVYDEIEEEMFAQLDSGAEVNAVNSGAAGNKCAQIANGGVYFEELVNKKGRAEDAYLKRNAQTLHDAKTDAIEDLVEELQGSPLLIMYEFEHDLTRLKARFKDLLHIGGGISPHESARIESLWNSDKLPYLAGHPAAMGHGLNLQRGSCHHIACYGLTWDYELYDQFLRRVRRHGNKNDRVFVHHIIARGTVDEAKMRRLRLKEKTQQSLLDALRAYRRTRKSK